MTDWATADTSGGNNKYSVSEFYTRSRERGKEHSGIRVNIPESLHGEIAELIASKIIPDYRTIADVVRDSLVHRLKYVADQISDGSLERAVTTTIRLDRAMKMDREQKTEETLVETWSRTLQRASRGELPKLIGLAREDQQGIHWQEYKDTLAELVQKYERYI